ncbi:unnamed protein product [Adineta ricciae]|uniref:VWFA domain-containing protein n=1 Tax=Adineta ricciae TaxID=249248 RepID=A0A815IEH5_ADIRI|nr:unnamed protein product [Adineta ricciae]
MNYTLVGIVNDYSETVTDSYHLYLIDTSTSMQSSDHWLFGWFGRSRFEQAKDYMMKIFEEEMKLTKHKVCLATFDTNVIFRVPFKTVDSEHAARLGLLEPVGKETALFDAIKECLDHFEHLNQIYDNPPRFLYILTDGKRNAGCKTADGVDAQSLNIHTNRLNIAGMMIHVGKTNADETRQISGQLGYQYVQLNEDNIGPTANSIMMSVKMKIKAAATASSGFSIAAAVEKTLAIWRETEKSICTIPDPCGQEGHSDLPRFQQQSQPELRPQSTMPTATYTAPHHQLGFVQELE